MQVGFGVDIMTWMGFSTYPGRLYEFFREQEFYGVMFEGGDFYEALDKRKKRRDEAMRNLLVGTGDTAPTQPAPDPVPEISEVAWPLQPFPRKPLDNV